MGFMKNIYGKYKNRISFLFPAISWICNLFYTISNSLFCVFTGASSCYESLSSDMLKNSLASFVKLGVVEASKS